jgi:hypothetical protein
MTKQTFSQFVDSLNGFLDWLDSNTIIVNNERYWKDADDYISNPLSHNDLVDAYAKSRATRYNILDYNENLVVSDMSAEECERWLKDKPNTYLLEKI